MNFNDVLKKKAADIEAPPLLPMGTYTMKVAKTPSLDAKSTDKGSWDILEFTLLPVAAKEDVDTDLLQKYGAFGPASAQRHSFMFNKDDQAAFDRTLFNLKRFLLEHLQIPGDDNSSLQELMDQAVGQHCEAYIGWEPDRNNPEVQYPRIKRTSPML